MIEITLVGRALRRDPIEIAERFESVTSTLNRRTWDQKCGLLGRVEAS
jgi:hypothetical protein